LNTRHSTENETTQESSLKDVDKEEEEGEGDKDKEEGEPGEPIDQKTQELIDEMLAEEA
jgi:hypothetical protein